MSRRWRYQIVVALSLLLAAGCRQLTDVEAPDLVSPAQLDNAAGAATRYSGAIVDFASAYSEQVAESGLISDEFRDVGANSLTSDRRSIFPANSYPFDQFSLARISALRAIATLQRYAPSPAERIGELYSLVGYVEVMFVENLCSPLPLASIADGIPAESPTYSREALVAHALSMFDSAAAHTGGDETIADLARVGRARALLLRSDLSSAADAVADVPITFEYRVFYSASVAGQANTVNSRIGVGRYVSVSDGEGINGLHFVSSADSRVGAVDIGMSRVGLPVYNYANDLDIGSPIVLASGVEASLIRAEAALAKGDAMAWADTLNSLRANASTPAIPPLPDDSTSLASSELRQAVHFHERAFWLFGTGHRQGDLRRLVRQYGRSVEAVFPTGDYVQVPGVRYGPDVTFVPSGEGANTSYAGCTDHGA
jgi:hypothetical protein